MLHDVNCEADRKPRPSYACRCGERAYDRNPYVDELTGLPVARPSPFSRGGGSNL